jgi:hypothetical protein
VTWDGILSGERARTAPRKDRSNSPRLLGQGDSCSATGGNALERDWLHIHATDSETRGTLNRVLLGTGLVPFKEMLSCLKQACFGGWICVQENSQMGQPLVEA